MNARGGGGFNELIYKTSSIGMYLKTLTLDVVIGS